MKIDYRVWRWLSVIADAEKEEGWLPHTYVVTDFALEMMEKMDYV